LANELCDDFYLKDSFSIFPIYIEFNNYIQYLCFFFWISVSDLLDYITPDADMKAREAQKKARAKVKKLPT
jgi:hypothetical protein